MADATADLVKALNTSAAYQAAKYGGGAPTSKLGGLLDILLPAYQAAFPKAPAANLAMGARQAWNLRQYNQQVRAAQEAEIKRQTNMDENNAAIYNSRTGQNISGPFDVTLANSSAPDIRKDNATGSLNTLLGGGALRLGQHADYDPALIRDYLGQQSKATDFINQGSGLAAIASGQGQSLSGGGQAGQAPTPSLQQGVMDDGTGQPMLSAGISSNAPPKQIDTMQSPYLLPTDTPSNVSTLMGKGMEDARGNAGLTETNRHNVASESEIRRSHGANEGIARINAAANTLRAQKYQPGGGGYPPQPNEASRAYDAFQKGLITREEYAQTLGAKSGSLKIPKMTAEDNKRLAELKQEYNNQAGGFFKNPNAARAAAESYNQMADQYGQPHIGESAPFKNKSVGNLKSKLGLKW